MKRMVGVLLISFRTAAAIAVGLPIVRICKASTRSVLWCAGKYIMSDIGSRTLVVRSKKLLIGRWRFSRRRQYGTEEAANQGDEHES